MAHDGHAGACRSILQALLQVEDLHTGANSSMSSSLQDLMAFHAHWQHVVGAHCSIINNKRGPMPQRCRLRGTLWISVVLALDWSC